MPVICDYDLRLVFLRCLCTILGADNACYCKSSRLKVPLNKFSMAPKRKCQLDLFFLPLHIFLGPRGKKNLTIYVRELMKFLEVTKAFQLLKRGSKSGQTARQAGLWNDFSCTSIPVFLAS